MEITLPGGNKDRIRMSGFHNSTSLANRKGQKVLEQEKDQEEGPSHISLNQTKGRKQSYSTRSWLDTEEPIADGLTNSGFSTVLCCNY